LVARIEQFNSLQFIFSCSDLTDLSTLAPSKMNQRFPKSVRLRTQSEFDAVYHGEAFAADDVLVIKAIRNGTKFSRLGLSVGKKVGNAVVRNHWKRRIREAFRLQRTDLPEGLDLVVRPKRGAKLDFQAIHRSIGRLAQRLDKKLEPSDSTSNS